MTRDVRHSAFMIITVRYSLLLLHWVYHVDSFSYTTSNNIGALGDNGSRRQRLQ